jgi:hypothetical protein
MSRFFAQHSKTRMAGAQASEVTPYFETATRGRVGTQPHRVAKGGNIGDVKACAADKWR